MRTSRSSTNDGHPRRSAILPRLPASTRLRLNMTSSISEAEEGQLADRVELREGIGDKELCCGGGREQHAGEGKE